MIYDCHIYTKHKSCVSTMGLEWSSYTKVKDNTLLVCSFELTPEVKDDIWLIHSLGKRIRSIKEAYFKDGFGAPRKNQWTKKYSVAWFHTINDSSFVEEDGKPVWENKRDASMDKWIVKLARIKEILAEADSDSDDDNSSIDYDALLNNNNNN